MVLNQESHNGLGLNRWAFQMRQLHTSSSLICFPKLVARAAGDPGWARLIAPIRFGMSRLFLGRSSRMRVQPWSMRTRSRHAIEEYRHMPSRYPDPDWQHFVPSLTAQALTVFPFPISTCQNIITRTVFESLCPIILFPILFLTVLQALLIIYM